MKARDSSRVAVLRTTLARGRIERCLSQVTATLGLKVSLRRDGLITEVTGSDGARTLIGFAAGDRVLVSEDRTRLLEVMAPAAALARTSRVVTLAARMTARPVSTLPVNAILSTSWCFVRAAPVDPPPGSTLTTPRGSPASSKFAASSRIVSGVCSAGFMTTVQPAQIAGASFQAASSSG